MSAISAGPEDRRLRLWGGSLLAVLMAHLAVAALLLQRLQAQREVALTGSAPTLDLDLLPATAAHSALPAVRAQLPPAPARPVSRPNVTASTPLLQPLPEAAPVTAEEPVTPDRTPPPGNDTSPATAAAVLASPDLSDLVPSTGAPRETAESWQAEVLARLQRNKQYPRSASRHRQQDTVFLQFAVNDAGQLLSVQVESRRHYQDLEDEARKMVQLAAPFPAPPPELRAEQIIVHVPLEFRLISVTAPPDVTAHCPMPADPGAAPLGSVATLEQMRAYRERLDDYLTTIRGYLDCIRQGTPSRASQSNASAARQVRASPATAALRNAMVSRVNGVVGRFNVQSRAFQAAVEQRAVLEQQARQVRFAQVQALAMQGYAACSMPAAPGQAFANKLPTADQLRTYHASLHTYDSAVHTYVQCIDRAHQASLLEAGSALNAVQRSQLTQAAIDLENAAVTPLNRAVDAFNAQLKAFETQVAAQVKQARRFTPVGTWSAPSPPLPAGECVRITYTGGSYRASLCRTAYTEIDDDLSSTDVTTGSKSFQTYFYSVDKLQVLSGRVWLTISKVAQRTGPRDSLAGTQQQFSLRLSSDGQQLSGACVIDGRPVGCRFSRRP